MTNVSEKPSQWINCAKAGYAELAEIKVSPPASIIVAPNIGRIAAP
jgi:hypothetical protein